MKAQCELGRKTSTRALGLAAGQTGQRHSGPWCLAVGPVAAAHAVQASLVAGTAAWRLLVAALEEGTAVEAPTHQQRAVLVQVAGTAVLAVGTAEGSLRATPRVVGLLAEGTASVEEGHRPAAGGTVKGPWNVPITSRRCDECEGQVRQVRLFCLFILRFLLVYCIMFGCVFL